MSSTDPLLAPMKADEHRDNGGSRSVVVTLQGKGQLPP